MICYQDRTFCITPGCKKEHALTDAVRRGAQRVGLPISTAYLCGPPRETTLETSSPCPEPEAPRREGHSALRAILYDDPKTGERLARFEKFDPKPSPMTAASADRGACEAMLDELERLQAALDNDFEAARPWEVHGDTRERPPMVWDGIGDAIVSQLDDGRPYFEPEVAALIVGAVNNMPKLLALARLAVDIERALRDPAWIGGGRHAWLARFDALAAKEPPNA